MSNPSKPQSTGQNLDDRLLTEKEAAHIVGFSVRTLQQRRYLDLPPRFVRLPRSRTIRYRLSDLRAYVEQGVVESGE